ncbi:MAG: phosphodiester glycosidase family protein [Chloroflexi bacterium]|nr:phosphodiester glycosidase family protein [Chloroflexota bacterium]
MVDGEKATWQDNAYMNDLHPRTAVAVDQSGRHLILLVVDGRQANYSEGATLDEAANLLLEFGAWDAINLDGGGSTTLVIADSAGNPVQLNSPIHTHVPGRERPVGNHLGLIAPSIAS